MRGENTEVWKKILIECKSISNYNRQLYDL